MSRSHQDSAARGQSIPLVFFAVVPSPRIEMFTDPFRTVRVLTAALSNPTRHEDERRVCHIFESWRYSVVSVSAAEVCLPCLGLFSELLPRGFSLRIFEAL